VVRVRALEGEAPTALAAPKKPLHHGRVVEERQTGDHGVQPLLRDQLRR
jgi:hypothetical protein